MNRRPLIISLLLCLVPMMTRTASAKEFANVEYLCCAWGPAMKLPNWPNEKPQFDDSQEEVYFLKQVGTFTRGLMGGNQGHGVSIYLCKMKADGSEKTEIKELWRNPNYPVDTQDCTTWMDVCAKTRQIGLTITVAGSDITGLWTMNLDGGDLRRIINPVLTNGLLQAVGGVSWTPDGQWIIYGESLRGTDRNGRIAKCDRNGENRDYLTAGPLDNSPRVSPDGKQVGYIHWVGWASRLYLMNVDGTNQRPLPNPDDKQWGAHGGLFPAWSPDGKEIFIIGGDSEVIDAETGRTVFDRRPMLQGRRDGTCGWPHWGRQGFIGFSVGGILFTDLELREAKWIGSSKLVECPGPKDSCRW